MGAVPSYDSDEDLSSDSVPSFLDLLRGCVCKLAFLHCLNSALCLRLMMVVWTEIIVVRFIETGFVLVGFGNLDLWFDSNLWLADVCETDCMYGF